MNKPSHVEMLTRLVHWLDNDQTPKFSDEERRKLLVLKELVTKWIG